MDEVTRTLKDTKKHISVNEAEHIRKELLLTREEINNIKTSFSFRIGSAITFIPKMILTTIYRFRQHGVYNTLFRTEVIYRDKSKYAIKKNYKYYKNLSTEKYPFELKEWYEKRTGTYLDLEHPKTYSEKIQWMKLYDRSPIRTLLADKYLVREWVKEKIGEQYLIPLLGVWDKFDKIDFDKLPDKFVLKANHGCSWNIIVKDKTNFDKRTARKKFSRWMSTDFAFCFGFELHYSAIPRKIVAEKYIGDDKELRDIKFMCFDGKPVFIWNVANRFSGKTRDFFDLNWNKLPFNYPENGVECSQNVPRPQRLDEMIELARILSSGIPHVRVDFYDVNGNIYFGEMTMTSGSGIYKWEPEEYDLKYGKMIKLPPIYRE